MTVEVDQDSSIKPASALMSVNVPSPLFRYRIFLTNSSPVEFSQVVINNSGKPSLLRSPWTAPIVLNKSVNVRPAMKVAFENVPSPLFL